MSKKINVHDVLGSLALVGIFLGGLTIWRSSVDNDYYDRYVQCICRDDKAKMACLNYYEDSVHMSAQVDYRMEWLRCECKSQVGGVCEVLKQTGINK